MLRALEQNTVPGFPGGSRAFFDLVREHALQGMFGDPFHGGNAGFIGWDLIGFAGVKLAFSAAEQQMDVTVVPAHKSTMDYALFKGRRKKGHNHNRAPPTTRRRTDVVVIGLGAAGGIAVLPLARAGLDVVGIEAGGSFSVRDFPRTRSGTTSATGSGGRR